MKMKQARQLAKMTQSEMAEAVGLSVTHLSRIESDSVEAPFWTPLIAAAIGRDPAGASAAIRHLSGRSKTPRAQRPPRWFLALAALMHHDQAAVADVLATVRLNEEAASA